MAIDQLSTAKIWAVAESSYAETPTTVPAAGDAIRFTQVNNQISQPPIENPEAGQGRTRSKDPLGRKAGVLSVNTLVRPLAAVGDTPEIDVFLAQAIGLGGTQGTGQGVYYRYRPVNDQSSSYRLYDESVAVQALWTGCVAQTMTLNWTGTGLTTATFAGSVANAARFNPFTIATVVANQNQAIGTLGDARDFVGVGNVIKFDTGAATVVTAATSSAFTVSTAQTAGSNVAVTSGLAAPAYSGGLPNFGTLGSLTMDDAFMPVRHRRGTLTFDNGTRVLNDEYGYAIATGVSSPARRTVTFSVTFIARDADIRRLAQVERNDSFNIILIMGNPAGRRVELRMPEMTFTPSGIQRQQDDVSEITLTGRASSDTENSEFEMRYY